MRNETYMKNLGESRVWKGIQKDSGDFKNISSTQAGQQLILKESLHVFELVKDWIYNGSAKTYRSELVDYFKNDDDFLLQKIAETYLFLAGSIYNSLDRLGNKSNPKTRHRKITTISKKILPDLDFNQVWRFTEVLIESSDYFSTENFVISGKKKYNTSIRYTCSLSDVILEQISNQAIKSFYPLPMRTAPIDWHIDEDGNIKGGYETFQYELVRANPVIKDYSIFSQEVFDSINYIQSTPWKINKEVVKAIEKDLEMPKKEDYVKESFPSSEGAKWDVDLKLEHNLTRKQVFDIEQARKEYREKVELYNAEMKDFESAVGKYRNVKMALQIANEFKDEVIYFPHSFDFRGRVYPIPVGLNPQGSDAIKAMLVYANTKNWTVEGMDWNFAYLASLYGDDKLPFIERRNRGIELINADYKDADEPYQFLSHQLELQKWTLDETYNPNTRIHLDACNSGSQFTSAITGDYEGCVATNVIPIYDEEGNQIRQDAYLLVADKATKLTEDKIESSESKDDRKLYNFFKELLVENGRKICKVPVMVSNYGGTTGGRADILWNIFRDLGVERKWISRKNAQLFAKIIGSSIYGVLSGGKAFEYYIQQMNNLIAKSGKSVKWVTQDGFYVRHVKNKEMKSRQISCMLPGARRKTTLAKRVYSDKLSPAKMKAAISPNYIHSLDAELLRRVALSMKKSGIKDSDWIHDSFGCHPNDANLMMDITKDEFYNLVNREPLKDLDRQLRAQVKDTKANKKELERIKMPDLGGFKVKEGDLNVLYNSEWFFS